MNQPHKVKDHMVSLIWENQSKIMSKILKNDNTNIPFSKQEFNQVIGRNEKNYQNVLWIVTTSLQGIQSFSSANMLIKKFKNEINDIVSRLYCRLSCHTLKNGHMWAVDYCIQLKLAFNNWAFP